MARLSYKFVLAADGYRIAVAYFDPFQKGSSRQVVIVNSGAAIPKSFYGAFAAWLADQGISVVLYDYRGIGGSRGDTVRHLKANISDWGSKDCAAVLEAAQVRYAGAPLSVIGHSIGSIVTGFVHKPPKIERMLLVSPHTGFFGDYASRAKIGMFLQWHVLMPFITRLVGYFPGRIFGLPEDLPYGVALGWARRRLARNTQEDAKHSSFSRIATTALVIRPEDDPFATRDAAMRVRAYFRNSRFCEYVLRVLPTENAIGHFGFFQPRNRERTWHIAKAWLEGGSNEMR